jgi:hypothetical protein
MIDQDIADAMLNPDHQGVALARITLKYAVQRAIFCAYCGKVLDVRSAVLLDGSDDGGRMDLMHADEWDRVLDKSGSVEALEAKLGYQVEVLDGRELFGRAS